MAVRGARFILIVFLLQGCGQKVQDVDAPTPPQIIFRTYGNPNSDPQRCGCAGSRPTFLENRGNTSKVVKWVEVRKDRFSGHQYDPQDGDITLPPTSGTQGHYIGCTIDAPNTSCRFDVEYAITTNTSLIHPGKQLESILGSQAELSSATCQAICSDPTSGATGTCLPLGVRYYAAVAPFNVMLERAVANGESLKHSEIMQELGENAGPDNCERGDVKNANGLLTNEGPSVCKFKNREITLQDLRETGFTKLSAPTSMAVYLPKKAAFQASGLVKTVGLLGSHISDETAPFIHFDGPAGVQYNRYYGGELQSISRIAIVGRPPQTVLQTSNGCIAIDERAR